MQKPGDLPEHCLQLENASRKGVQAALGILFSEKIPSPACRFAWQKGRRDFVFSANFGVRRQRRRFGFTERSKAASRYACRRTPNSFARDADRAGNVVLLRSTKENVCRSIATLGDLFGTHEQAATLVGDLRRRTDAVQETIKGAKPIAVFYQVSGEPLYTIGRESYLTDLVRRAGGFSVTAEISGAFPRYSDEAALAARPEAIILPSGGSMGDANSTVAASLKNSPAALNHRVYRINEDHLQ